MSQDAPLYSEVVSDRYGATTLVPIGIAVVTLGTVLFTPMASALKLGILAVHGTIFAGLLLLARMFRRVHIRVDAEALSVGFEHVHRQRVPLSEIAGCAPYRYRAIAEWGGWGYRLNHHGVMLNVMGDGGNAVRVERTTGRWLCFSAADPQAVCAAIDAARANA